MRFTKLQKGLISIGFLIFAALGLLHLDRCAVWDDEAQVGIIARNLVHTGRMTGWDGRNLYWYRNGSLLDDHLNYLNPPLDVLLAAASFKIFGVNDWALRLPFVFCGIISLAVFLFILKKQLPNSPTAIVYAFLTLACSVQFILYGRTGRYYEASALAILLMIYFVQKYFEKRKARYAVYFSFAMIISFYASYLLFCAAIASILGWLLLFRRSEFSKKEIIPILGASAIFLIATAPYVLITHAWIRNDAYYDPTNWIVLRSTLLWRNFRDINLTNSLTWSALVLLIVLWLARMKKGDDVPEKRAIKEWAVMLFSYILVLSALSPETLQAFPTADMRYLCAIVPIGCAITGLTISLLSKAAPFLAAPVFALLTFTNLGHLTPTATLQHDMPGTSIFRPLVSDLWKEETHPYPTPCSLVVDYLKHNAKQNDIVMTSPPYMQYPLEYYLGDKLYFSIQFQDKMDYQHKVPKYLPSYLQYKHPNWIFVFTCKPTTLDSIMLALQKCGPVPAYDHIGVMPIWSMDQYQKQDLCFHCFSPKTERFFSRKDISDIYLYGVHILKKR